MNDKYRVVFNPAIHLEVDEFKAEFPDHEAAKEALNLIADYTLFLHKENVMSDFSNCGLIQIRVKEGWIDLDE